MNIFRRALAVIALLVMVFAGINTSTAQEGGRGLQISPTRAEITANPGEVKIVKFQLKNISDTNMVAAVNIHDFESNNEGGEPQIIVDPNKKSDYSIKDFVTNLSDVQLKAGETKEVAININVPSDLAPGAYFGAVRYTANPLDKVTGADTPQVGLTASVAALVLVEVTGDVQESIKIESAAVGRGGKINKLFVKFPDMAAVRIANTGNSFVKPFGRVVIMKGDTEAYSYELNDKEPRGNVLPKSTRVFTNEIKNVSSFGRYKIVASIAPNQGGEVLTVTSNFWVIPLWVLILAGVLVLLLAIGILYLRFRMKSSKRHHRARR